LLHLLLAIVRPEHPPS